MILFDFTTFLIMVIAVAIPLGIGFIVGYKLGRKDLINTLKNDNERY